MLYVPVLVKPSHIHGLGIFARERIPKGVLVSAWTRGVDQEVGTDTIDRLPPCFRQFVETYGWRVGPNLWRFTVDDARFTNHSFAPSLEWRGRGGADGEGGSYAARDIKAGEELTENYADFDPDFGEYAQRMK